ncbi:MAG: type 1 glutamine amidotransferase [Thermoleophilia bacterium]|nr:type 1 glutamine amidotransferase [Thermoleophilia bacterium]
MRVHYVQHVPFEGVGAIADWIRLRGHVLSGTHIYESTADDSRPAAAGCHSSLPSLADLDFLVVMGGPMGVYDSVQYPWLEEEKTFLRIAVDAGKVVLGICLGAQLIADVLGAVVSHGPRPEIGWHPVELTDSGRAHPALAGFPNRFTVLHWHGDTFAVPVGAVHVASSAAYPNQAFALHGGRVVGLQFHLEETRESLTALVREAGNDLAGEGEPTDRPESGRWIATREEVLARGAPYDACRELLFILLDRMADMVRRPEPDLYATHH